MLKSLNEHLSEEMKEMKWHTIFGTIIMVLAAAILPLSMPYFTWLALIVFVIGTYLHFKISDYSQPVKIIIFLISITAVPFFIYQSEWRNSVNDRVIYILPDNYEGVFAIIYNVKGGVPVEHFTTNLKFDIPADGILLSKYNKDFDKGGLMMTGSQKFIFKTEFYSRTNSLIEDRSVSEEVQLSDLVNDTTITFVEPLGYKKFLGENGKEYGGMFFQTYKAGRKIINWKDIKSTKIIEKIKQL